MSNAAQLGAPTTAAAALQRETALHMTAGALALAAGAVMFGSVSDQALRTTLVSVGLFLPVAAIVLAKIAAYHPHSTFGLPNAVTTSRAVLNCLFAGGLSQAGAAPESGLAWSLVILAALSLTLDGIDGFLARRLGLSSPFGARYDMEVDALLILLLSVAAWSFGKAGVWVIASGAIRYGFVAAGWIWPSLRAPLPPSFRRKAVCVLQTAALGLLLAPFVTPPLSIGIAAIALAALVWSFGVDIVWLVRQARQPDQPEPEWAA